ncbi:hypothetical protein [Hansschlegelia sp.]|uniref:hypothetical protein n=1 Tax=Hansschlegelia sp. TaxID=2041892 RepID=UPI002D0B5EED|nr:hypothetical protein [Hansschlegelia sp.]HVI29955.1 hypothetical protein [Hansschlegelia sp.]
MTDAPAASEPIGRVETFDETSISGWLRVPEGGDARSLDLCLNGQPVAAAKTSDVIGQDGSDSIRRFRLRLKSLWNYTKSTDRLSITFEGDPLFIEGHGFYRRPRKSGPHTSSELFSKIAAGYVFNQKGRLQLSKELDKEWQAAVFALYDRVRHFLKEELDTDLMVIYGTLLGAARAGKFIGRDHDFDVGYLSKETTPPEVKAEAERIIHALWDAGYIIRVKKSCFYVKHPEIPGAQIDIGRLFFDKKGVLHSAFGFAGRCMFRLEDFDGYQEIELEGRNVLAVKNVAGLLRCIYGESWQIPNPGFHWRRERARTSYKARFNAEEILRLTEYKATRADANANAA